jgi:hypothetical protein
MSKTTTAAYLGNLNADLLDREGEIKLATMAQNGTSPPVRP